MREGVYVSPPSFMVWHVWTRCCVPLHPALFSCAIVGNGVHCSGCSSIHNADDIGLWCVASHLLHQTPGELTAPPGTLGSAILVGLLANSAEVASSKTPLRLPKSANGKDIPHGHARSSPESEELRPPTHYIACVRTTKSVQRLKKELAKFPYPVPVTILQGENVRAVQAADTVLLGCQPGDLEACLGVPTIKKAITGKLLISILAGVTIPQIEAILSPTKSSLETNGCAPTSGTNPHQIIVRAMPNTACFVRASTTVITSTPTATPSALRLVDYLFTAIGTVTHIQAAQFDACTALCGSTPAFFALFLESLLDGAVALGLRRSEAQTMAAETMKGAAMLLLGGETPEQVKEKVATPGGSTIQGLLELERKALRGSVADALVKCTAAAGGLGGGNP